MQELEPAVLNKVNTWLNGSYDAAVKQEIQKLVDQIITFLVAGRFDHHGEHTNAELFALLNKAADDVRPFLALIRK